LNFLDKILEVKKEEVKNLRKKYSLNSFKEMEFFDKDSLSFTEKVNSNRQNSLSIIAEIKKASPSKGIIKEDFNHLEIAKAYLKNNVDAISVLTDKQFFSGNISFLSDIAKIKTVPLLRKDFIIDEFQIFEAKANGADIILLISEALSKEQIKSLSQTAYDCKLEVLLELHSENQLDKIDFNINKIIGVNNRNLVDFNVDLNTTAKLSKQIPDVVVLVSESGIGKKENIDYLKQADIDAVLVGEHLMRSGSIDDKITELKSWCKK
jgi:indole-3-glycerol phosphate synthase